MKFSEMPYKRIDMEEVEKEYKSIIERTKNAKSGKEQFEIHREYYKFTADVQTSMELAMIRHDIDTTDEFYEKESDFYDEVGPIISQYENEYGKVLYDSPYRDYLESKIGKVTFKNIEIANKAFDEKIIPLMQEENALSSRYSKLIATAKIPFEGEVYNLSLMRKFQTSPDREVADLLFLYRQEKMGKSQWQCMEELIRIIQQDVVEFPQVSVSPSVSGIPDTDMTLDNIFAIYACIRKAMINASDSTICLCTPEISLEHLRYLVQIIHEVPYRRLEHLFPLLQNQTTENTLDNLRKICSLKPAMNYENYKPFYYYVSSAESEAKKAGLLPNWLITDHIAIGINFHTAKGIILRDAQQIQLLKNSFIQERKIAKEMLFCSDLNAYVKDVNVMMNEGYVTHNYYIEYSPCLLHLIPLNVLKQQIILDGVEKEQLLSSLFQRIRHMETESMVHIFCISGLRQLMEQGRIAGYPDMLYKPLDPAMRLWLLKSYYQYMLHTPHSCICVKENFVQLPKHISIVCSSNVHNGIAFWNNTSHGLQYYILKESGFSQKLYEFCQFLENGNMAWSQEETLDIIRNMILEYGGTL